MNCTDFSELLARFNARPTMPLAGGRHVYLWRGEPAALEPFSPGQKGIVLDLHGLARLLEHKPTGIDAARRILGRAIEAWLRVHRAPDGSQQIVVVSGCDLLMRYQVSLGAFFQAVSDTRMVILTAPSYPTPLRPLPRYVDFRPSATLDYLRSLLSEAAIVE